MCGIVGQMRVTSDAGPVDLRLVRAMASLIEHRGPDEEGFYDDEHVGLGMRRLSIIDLTEGNQPIHNEDRDVWIVFNGEIFNFRPLREHLIACGHRFYTGTDTEVIVHLYEEFGEDFVHHLRGMFAIALWDAKAGKLVVARDRLGIKPLYYSFRRDTLLFGSEMKSLLLAPQVSREVDPRAVDLYLTFRYVPSPYTLLADVRKLPPGHVMTVCDNRVNIRKYWDLEGGPPEHDGVDECERALLSKLQECVTMRLVSDVPLGVLLSGGIDSSAVVGLMARAGVEDIETFTVGFEGADDLNEFGDARRVASKYATNHREMLICAEDYDGFLPKFVWHLDEPVADFSAVAFYYITKLAREHVTVALSGQGADELFAGYSRYSAEKLSGAYRRLPRSVRSHLVQPLVSALPGSLNLKRAARSLGESEFVARYLGINEVFEPSLKARVYSHDFARTVADNDARQFLADSLPANAGELTPLQRTLYLDTKYWLGDYLLLYTDKLSMANSLEARVPFLDHELVSECFRLPDSMKMRGAQRKYLLKRAVHGLVPDENIYKKKMGFLSPGGEWLRGSLSDYVNELLLSDRAISRGYFSRDGVRSLIDLNASGREEYGRHIFCLMMLEVWFRVFVDGEYCPT